MATHEVKVMKRFTDNADLAALSQRLWRLLYAALELENSTIKILERTSLYSERPDDADIAEVVDAVHVTFNRFQQLTKVALWHDDEQDGME